MTRKERIAVYLSVLVVVALILWAHVEVAKPDPRAYQLEVEANQARERHLKVMAHLQAVSDCMDRGLHQEVCEEVVAKQEQRRAASQNR